MDLAPLGTETDNNVQNKTSKTLIFMLIIQGQKSEIQSMSVVLIKDYLLHVHADKFSMCKSKRIKCGVQHITRLINILTKSLTICLTM